MPFKSKSQRRFMFAAEARGDVPEGTAERWEAHTEDKDLPEKVAELVTLAALGTRTTLGFTQAPKIQTGLKTFKSRQSMHAGTTHKGFGEHVSAGTSTPIKAPAPTVGVNTKIAAEQLVPGGKGRNKTVDDFDAEEVRIGLKVEREHFVGGGMSDEDLKAHATEIVLDHLTEDEHYYTKTKHDFKKEIKKEAMSGKAKALTALAAGAAGIAGAAASKSKESPQTLGKGIKLPNKRLLNNAIRTGKGDFQVEYTKADGTPVQRKVRPITAKGKVVVVHDYERDAIRSFRADRVSKLEKAAQLMREKLAYAQQAKLAGGPGSGVKGDNTLAIGLPMSKYVSVGTRKALLDNMPYYEAEIPMEYITAVGQEKYVPAKLNRMMDSPDALNNPIHLLHVDDNEYHVIDGHHRYLVARKRGVKTIRAKVYTKRED